MRRFLLLFLCVACQRTITESPQNWNPPVTRGERSVDFVCASDTSRDPALRRLTAHQLSQTLHDVLVRLLGDTNARAAESELEVAASAVPHDLRLSHATQTGQLLFARSDSSIGAVGVDANYRLGLAIGAALSTDERLRQMGFECAIDAETDNDDGCIDEIIDVVGRLTHRRPLDAETHAFFRGAYSAGRAEPAAIADLLAVLFTQPHFVFHVEGEGDLDAYEVASRLSYQFWDSMPDEALMGAAESGALMSEEGWRSQVQRVIDDPRTRNTIRTFLLEWFRFDQLNPASSGTGPDFEAIAGNLELDATFDAAVEDELVDLFMHTLRSGGTFEDFFLSEVTTTTHPVLARIYGVEPSRGEPVRVPAERRSILTRVGLLLARAEVALPNLNSITHPILRGVFVRRQILCDELPDAPGGAMDNLPTIDHSSMGAREATERLTGGAGCVGCHIRINGTGYALERFDPIGQFRDEETLFDASGNATARLEIDERVELREADDTVVGGAAMAAAFFESEKASACFARHYARFSLGRSESVDEDGCLLRAMDESIDSRRPLYELLSAFVLEPGFRRRADSER